MEIKEEDTELIYSHQTLDVLELDLVHIKNLNGVV